MNKKLLRNTGIGLLTIFGCVEVLAGGGVVTDVDKNTYKTLKIGTQEWMSENLRTTKYSDGTPIPNVTDSAQWSNLSTAAWCHYDNVSSQYDATYGKLYNWYAVNTNKLCPSGWHVPTETDWTVLIDYLASNGNKGTQGKALKSKSGWNDKRDGTSGNGTDDYGWLGLPSGFRDYSGSFINIGNSGHWWSSSEASSSTAWASNLFNRAVKVDREYGDKIYGASVRCLRD